MADLSPRSWGIPVVASTAERDALFPSPATNQRVQNLETGRLERWSGTAWVPDSLVVRNAQLFGVLGDGSSNDMTSLIAAVSNLPTTGGAVILPEGKIVLSGDPSALWSAINSKQSVAFVGQNGPTSVRGNLFPPAPAATVLYVKDLTDYLYVKSGTTTQSLTFQDLSIDGSSGGGTGNGSTTCPGVIAYNGGVGFNFRMLNVSAHDFLYGHVDGAGAETKGRAVLDLDVSVWTVLRDCFLGDVGNGRIIYTGPGSTTFLADHCYLQGAREIYYHRGSTSDGSGITYRSCVFESSTVVGAQYLAHVKHDGCHYENIGQSTGSGHTTGLAQRDHGLTFGGGILTGTVNRAISQLYGSLTITDGHFAGLTAAVLDAWFECLGVGGITGNGGSLSLRGCAKFTGADRLFASTMAFGATERSSYFTILLEEAYGTTPGGAMIAGNAVGLADAGDARKINTGHCIVVFNDSTGQKALIRRGRFHYDIEDTATAFTAAPAAGVFPVGGQHLVGDRITLPAPTAGGNIGLVCTTAGNPGTWKGWGAIAA